MKKLAFLGLAFFFWYACQQETDFPIAKDYPIIITNTIQELTETGATFSAKIHDLGSNTTIKEIGFIWKGNGNEFRQILPDVKLAKGELISFRVTSNLEQQKEYAYQGYIQTEDQLILGNEIRFISLGSAMPTVANLSPNEGFDGTKVTIMGDNFSQLLENNLVYVNEIKANIVEGNQETLTFTIPASAFVGLATIRIAVGEQEITLAESFRIIGPEIATISKTEGVTGDMLIITGTHFTNSGTNLSVIFDRFPLEEGGLSIDEFSAEILSISEQEIHVKVPLLFRDEDFLQNVTLPIQVRNGRKKTVANEAFTILKTWEERQPTPFESGYNYQGFEYAGKGYMVEYRDKELFEYNPSSNSWSKVANYPGDRLSNDLFISINQKVIRLPGTPNTPIWTYDFLAQEWIESSPTPFNFGRATYIEFDGTIYITTDKKELWKYQPNRNQFDLLDNGVPTGPFTWLFSFVQDNNAYLVTYESTFIFNRTKEKWVMLQPTQFNLLNISRASSGFYHKGKGYIVEGIGRILRFNAENSEWEIISRYPAYDDSYKTYFTLDGEAYIMATQSGFVRGAPFMFKYLE